MNESMHPVIERSHPLTTSFDRLRHVNEHVKAHVGVPDGDNWFRPKAYFEQTCLDNLGDQIERQYDTSSRAIVAGLLLSRYQWSIVVTTLASYLHDRRVPNLTADNLWLHWNADHNYMDGVTHATGLFTCLPRDDDADHSDAMVLSDRDALRDHLRQQLEDHFTEAITRISHYAGLRARALWPTVADHCAGTVLWLGEEMTDRGICTFNVRHEVQALLHVDGSPLYNKITDVLPVNIQPGETLLSLRRAACCHAFRQEACDYCPTCPHLPLEERVERIRTTALQEHSASEAGQ